MKGKEMIENPELCQVCKTPVQFIVGTPEMTEQEKVFCVRCNQHEMECKCMGYIAALTGVTRMTVRVIFDYNQEATFHGVHSLVHGKSLHLAFADGVSFDLQGVQLM